MKPKTMILLGLAVTCGLGASYMTSRLLADRGDTEKETVEVLQAKRNVNIGERLVKPEDVFEKKTILKENDKQLDAIRDIEQLKGKIMRKSRNMGDTITPADMYGDKENLDIPDGHLAVGLPVNQETSASGLASLPGSRVDLIWFQRGPNNETSRIDVLLQDVYVLAADGKIDRDGLTAVASIVTLALTQNQNLEVTLAKETGIIKLALRKGGDKELPRVPGFSGDDLRKRLALLNKKIVDQPADAMTPDEGPPKTEVKAAVVLPRAAAKGQMAEAAKPQAVEPVKTYKREFTIIQNDRVEHIVREFAEDGTLLNESRRVSESAPQAQPAPAQNIPARPKKGPSGPGLEI